jgi:hypothetical protein
MGGGGNWEFQAYTNNRSTSFVENGVLHLKPLLMRDVIGEENVKGNNFRLSMWGSSPADMCTGNEYWGCERSAGGGGNYLNPVLSARIRTPDSMTIKYGKVEIRAKLPKGNWIWPAIWMLPRHNSYGSWPTSGEIDIMESRGNPTSEGLLGHNTFGSTLHWGPHWFENMYPATHHDYIHPTSLGDEFHTYTLIWDEYVMQTYIDNTKVLDVDMSTSFWDKNPAWPSKGFKNPWAGRPKSAPFDREFYLVMNVAVGGLASYFPDGAGGKPWSNTAPHGANLFYDAIDQWLPSWHLEDPTHPNALKVDYVRVWCDEAAGYCKKPGSRGRR